MGSTRHDFTPLLATSRILLVSLARLCHVRGVSPETLVLSSSIVDRLGLILSTYDINYLHVEDIPRIPRYDKTRQVCLDVSFPPSVHTHTHTYVPTPTHTHVHTHTRKHTHAHTHARTHTRARTVTHSRIKKHEPSHTCKHTHTPTNTHTHRHTYTRT